MRHSYRVVQDDGLYLPSIKKHSLEKLARHELYASIFAKSMSRKWKQLAYVGLYSGSGRARIEGTGEIVETAPLSALRLVPGFTHHIFVDKDARCTEALAQRVTALGLNKKVDILTADVNESAYHVRRLLPSFSKDNGLLTFCFVDPFAADLHFDTFRALAGLKVDFLVLLMLGADARRNFRRYRDDPTSTRIADLIACPGWREEFGGTSAKHLIPFLLRKFDEAMVSLGYHGSHESDYHRVTAAGKNVLQYVLAFYSKHQLGRQFWRESLTSAAGQGSLDL